MDRNQYSSFVDDGRIEVAKKNCAPKLLTSVFCSQIERDGSKLKRN